MKTYKIYKHPVLGTAIIKAGFSWPGFCFGLFWLLAKKMWKYASIYIVGLIVWLIFKEAAADSASTGFKLLIVAIWWAAWICIGFKGNYWRISTVEKRGYSVVKEVQANTADQALASIVEV
jgi:predicted Na+-dependent transporter